MRDVLERGARHRIDQVLRNDVAGKRIRLDAAAGDRPPRERVVDLVLRPERQQLREVAVAHLLGRHGRRAVVARPRFVDALEAVHEERPAPAVVAGQQHRPAGRAAVAVVGEVGERDVVGVGEEVVGEQPPRRLGVVGGAREASWCPALMLRLVTPPSVLPSAASKVAVCTLNSWTMSGGGT